MRELTVVIPIYNEEESLPELVRQILDVLPHHFSFFQCIFVNDGSTDNSQRVILDLKRNNPWIELVSFEKNLGQSAALMAGFQKAESQFIVTLDADLQNDPSDIPRLINQLKEGYDFVNGRRVKRKDPFLKRLTSFLANRLIMRLTGVRIYDTGCGIKAYRQEAAKSLDLSKGLHRFIPILISQTGFKIIEIPVNHRPRIHGHSKYGLCRLFYFLKAIFILRSLKAASLRARMSS